MTDGNDLFATRPINAAGDIVECGDVALLLKRDGSVRALTFGYDKKRLLQPNELHTEEDRAMLEQGQKLFALAFAAGNPKLMATLIAIASDPQVVDFATLTAAPVKH